MSHVLNEPSDERRSVSTRRRRYLGLGLVTLVGAFALTIVPSALNSASPHGLSAYVVATTRGPLPACQDPTGATCTSANTVWHYIHVTNSNRAMAPTAGGSNRTTLPGSFVVTGIDSNLTVDGVAQPTFTYPAPPGYAFFGAMGRWPSTVTCTGAPGAYSAPCNVVLNPAVIAGENTVILFAGWTHTVGELNGKYAFKYTIHGTIDGTPVDLVATAPAILMTG